MKEVIWVFLTNQIVIFKYCITMLHLNLFMQLGPSWMALKVGCQMKYSKRFRRLTIYLFIHFNARLFLPEKNLKDLKFVFFDFWLSRFKWFKREKANCFKRFYWSHGTPFSWLSASSSSCQTSLLLIIHDFLFFFSANQNCQNFFLVLLFRRDHF